MDSQRPSSPSEASSAKRDTAKILKIMEEEFELLKKFSKTYEQTSSQQRDISIKIASLLERNNELIERLYIITNNRD